MFWDFLVKMFSSIWDALKRLGKIIFRAILSFANNIARFFKDPLRLKKLKEQKNKLAVSIKENMENGNYNVVNCLYDQNTGEVDDLETDGVGIESNELDAEARLQFGNKDMIILK